MKPFIRRVPLFCRRLSLFGNDRTGGLKTNYAEFMTTMPVRCDEELKRLPAADYDLCCALLTMFLREDYFMYNKFNERFERGDVGRITDRMLALLKAEEQSEIKPGRYRRYKGNEYEQKAV